MTYRYFLLVLTALLCFQCKPATESSGTEAHVLPEDFGPFYERFHRDSLYQLSHISFPLEGVQKVNQGPGNILLPVRWQKEEWVMHRPFNDHDGQFAREYSMVGSVVIEYIHDRGDFFSMERRFARLGGEWHLIYYGLKK